MTGKKNPNPLFLVDHSRGLFRMYRNYEGVKAHTFAKNTHVSLEQMGLSKA